MRTNLLDLIVILALAFACANLDVAHGKGLAGSSSSSASGKTLNDYLADLDEKQANLEGEFSELTKKFFFEPQEKAKSELMQTDQANGYKMREISNVITIIEYVKYAVRRKVNQATREILSEKFGQKLDDCDLVLDVDLAAILVDRFELRSLVDGYKSTSFTWNELYTLIPHEKAEVPQQMLPLIEEIFHQRTNFGKLAYATNERMTENVEKFCKKNGYTASRVAGLIYLVLDSLIDQAMGCPQCSELFEVDEDSYGVYPMFSDLSEMEELALALVDAKLLESIRESRSETQDHVRQLTDYELEQVEESDIEDLQDDYIETPFVARR